MEKTSKLRGTRWPTRFVALLAALAAGTLGAAAPARAAVPDAHGFLLWTGAVVPSGTWPPATTVTTGAVGEYRITFPGQAAVGGVVHVTAIYTGPVWCQAQTWKAVGANEVADIRCYSVGGVPSWSSFAAIFTSSSLPAAAIPGLYGYVDALPTGAIISEFNSAGSANIVTPLAPVGRWLVRFPGLGTPGPNDGSLQATAVNSAAPVRCRIAAWGSGVAEQQAVVVCHDAAGVPVNTRFTISYQYQRSLWGPALPPSRFGYIWNRPPPPLPNPGPPPTNYNSVSGGNFITWIGVGNTKVTYPGLASSSPDDSQVTSFGGVGSQFCNLYIPWFDMGPDVVVPLVVCYTNAGAFINSGYLATHTSQA